MNGGFGFMKKATGVIAAAVAVLTVMPVSEVKAQTSNTIFPDGWDKSVRNRMFMRLSAIYVNPKTKASDATDLTGPVITRADFQAIRDWMAANPTVTTLPGIICANNSACRNTPESGLTRGNWDLILTNILDNPAVTETAVGGTGLGTPPGVKAKIGDAMTAALSVGYWLTSDFTWAMEAFLLAKPLDVKVYGAGMNQGSASGEPPAPNGVSGRHIVSTKMLPPLAIISRHFGSTKWPVRPFVGLGMTYAVLYDAKATGFYENYVGGKTSVTVKNAFGVGPFVGLTSPLNDSWHVNVQVGQINLKTEAVLTTRNTVLTNASAVGGDFSPVFTDAYNLGYGLATSSNRNNSGITGLLSRFALHATNREDFGTYSRKQEQKIKATMVNVSIGYNF